MFSMDIGPLPCHAANAEVRSSETRQIDLLVKPKLFSVNCFSGGGQTFEQDFKLILAFDKTDHTVWVDRVNEFQSPVLETDRVPLDANASGLNRRSQRLPPPLDAVDRWLSQGPAREGSQLALTLERLLQNRELCGWYML